MDITYLIQTYGYLAVALGSFLEGEAILLAGSLAAWHGHLSLPIVWIIAVIASFLGNLPYFFAGRRFGAVAMRRVPALRARRRRLERLLQRHHLLIVPALRFLYGLRIVGLVTLGAGRMPVWRYMLLDLAGAIVWAACVCAAGYGAGGLFRRVVEAGATTGQLAVVAGVLGATLLWLVRRRVVAAKRGRDGR
ncbi:DedA family protein [Noviherbaspirillum sp. ST9]|uniref:DedA family protein n=1 Tax=Noviherbaspirillum sp. ST9 TaxID=3401606 RepID=UPI003B589E5E